MQRNETQGLNVLFIFRGVWGGVLWTHETPGEKRHPSGPEDPESGIHREAEEGLSGRGVHHGPVRPPQRHPSGGSGNTEYADAKTILKCRATAGCLGALSVITYCQYT